MEEVVADVVAVAEGKKEDMRPTIEYFFLSAAAAGARSLQLAYVRGHKRNSDRRIRNAPIRGIAIYTSNSLTTVGIYHNNKISKGVS